jgi:hypothetical protein
LDSSHGTTPTFRYNPAAGNNVNQIDDAGLNSRWQIQTELDSAQ